MAVDPNSIQLDLNSLARKVVQRLDRRNQNPPRQPVTRVAVQTLGTVQSNRHRILNYKSAGISVAADATNRRANIAIPCGYLYTVVDGGGQVIVPSSRPQSMLHIHDNLQIVQWIVIADVSGSITFDLKRATYANYPSTASITNNASPVLAGAQKNKSADYIDPLTGVVSVNWTPLGWQQLNVGDLVDVVVVSSATVSRVTLMLIAQAL